MATLKKELAAGPADTGLKVTSRPPSFRRGGYAFTGEACIIPLSELTKEQAESIKADTNLVCQLVDIKPEKDADKA